MVEFINLLIILLPFILGLIAIALIPTRRKYTSTDIDANVSMDPEVPSGAGKALGVIYLLSTIVMIFGVYYFMLIMSDSSDNLLLNLLNGSFLMVIGIGTIGASYRNQAAISISTGTDVGISGIGATELGAVEPMVVEESEVGTYSSQSAISTGSTSKTRIEHGTTSTTTTKTASAGGIQMVGCPQCGTAISVRNTGGPVKISCPKCGIEGMVQ